MQTWLRISLLLCTFGFFRELRPSEPFVAEYFVSEKWHNITIEQVNQEIYPFGTYFVLMQLVVIFLVTDILRYKPIIVVSAGAGIILFAILLWTYEVWELQIGQFFYGTFMASEVAYYTYIYAKVDKARYQLVTGHTRSAILCGKFLGGVLAQLLVSTALMDYRELHYISFGSQIISLFIAFALPPVERSLYFYTDAGSELEPPTRLSIEGATSKSLNIEPVEPAKEVSAQAEPAKDEPTKDEPASHNSTTAIANSKSPQFSWRKATRLLVQHTVSAYTNPTVLQWSLWWALATCGQLQVISYAQILWKEIYTHEETYYNGAVEATVTLLGAFGAMTAGVMNSNRHKEWHIWILTICSLLMGAFLIISAVTNIIWIAYVMYILFGTFYFFVITIASAIVAENLSDDSFGLIFGINTLVALLLQTILTLVVVTDSVGFGLAPRDQYIVYGFYFIGLAVLYCAAVVVRFMLRMKSCC